MFAAELNEPMEIDHSTEPGMPWIEHLSNFGHMGFAMPSCIIKSGHTARLATGRRTSGNSALASARLSRDVGSPTGVRPMLQRYTLKA